MLAACCLPSLFNSPIYPTISVQPFLDSTYLTIADPKNQVKMQLYIVRRMYSNLGIGEIYIVVDALNGCPNPSGCPTPQEDVLAIMEELVDLCLPHLHFCITSRLEVDIRDAVQPLTDHNVSLHEQAGQNRDIFDYVKSFISFDREMQRWREEDGQLVFKTLSEKAGCKL